jgi:hypothetical protein
MTMINCSGIGMECHMLSSVHIVSQPLAFVVLISRGANKKQ